MATSSRPTSGRPRAMSLFSSLTNRIFVAFALLVLGAIGVAIYRPDRLRDAPRRKRICGRPGRRRDARGRALQGRVRRLRREGPPHRGSCRRSTRPPPPNIRRRCSRSRRSTRRRSGSTCSWSRTPRVRSSRRPGGSSRTRARLSGSSPPAGPPRTAPPSGLTRTASCTPSPIPLKSGPSSFGTLLVGLGLDRERRRAAEDDDAQRGRVRAPARASSRPRSTPSARPRSGRRSVSRGVFTRTLARRGVHRSRAAARRRRVRRSGRDRPAVAHRTSRPSCRRSGGRSR